MPLKKGRCKHYSKNVCLNGECQKGVNVRALVGGEDFGWLSRKPCAQPSEIICSMYEDPTDKEIEEHNSWVDLKIKQLETISPLIYQIKIENPAGGSGKIECPVCKNTLLFTVSSYNGHTRGQCKTDGCLNWME